MGRHFDPRLTRTCGPMTDSRSLSTSRVAVTHGQRRRADHRDHGTQHLSLASFSWPSPLAVVGLTKEHRLAPDGFKGPDLVATGDGEQRLGQ
jgi:hypothetical protein